MTLSGDPVKWSYCVVEKCCNKRMSRVEYTLQSDNSGCRYDVLNLFSCAVCSFNRGWAYRIQNDDELVLVGWLAKESIGGWKKRIDSQMVTRDNYLEKRAMVHISDGTKLISRDVANIYRKILYGAT